MFSGAKMFPWHSDKHIFFLAARIFSSQEEKILLTPKKKNFVITWRKHFRGIRNRFCGSTLYYPKNDWLKTLWFWTRSSKLTRTENANLNILYKRCFHDVEQAISPSPVRCTYPNLEGNDLLRLNTELEGGEILIGVMPHLRSWLWARWPTLGSALCHGAVPPNSGFVEIQPSWGAANLYSRAERWKFCSGRFEGHFVD